MWNRNIKGMGKAIQLQLLTSCDTTDLELTKFGFGQARPDNGNRAI